MLKESDHHSPHPAPDSSSEQRERNNGSSVGVGLAASPQFPSVSLPRGGGAIRGIGEKFTANPVTGTGSGTIPLGSSPGRSGFGPQLELSYDSGSGNGPFGFGWSLSLPAITRKTDKGLPLYRDAEESDVFILAGAEDLVPVLVETSAGWVHESLPLRNSSGRDYAVQRYRPRIESSFVRIERWTDVQTGDSHWRSITRDNVTTLYGKDDNSRIVGPPSDSHSLRRIFSWLICESYDDKGNAIAYEYESEDGQNLDRSHINESARLHTANRHLKRIKYGNKISRLIQPDPTLAEWLFEVIFDYDEGHYEVQPLDSTRPAAEQHQFVLAAAAQSRAWSKRPDSFSSYRSGFEVRTHRRCQRVLMFHRFDELGTEPYLVRATEFDYADLDYSLPTTIDAELAHPGSSRFASFIRGVTQSGFVRDAGRPIVLRHGVSYLTYLRKSLPPLEFEYSKAIIREEIEEVDATNLENLPIGLDTTSYHWVDLDGEGLSGVLTEQGDAWFYKRNLSPLPGQVNQSTVARFAPVERLATMPWPTNLSRGQQLLDLDGNGQLDVVDFGGTVPGFSERTSAENWRPFREFESLPNISWQNPNLRFVDLTGDGLPDVLVTEDEVFIWYPSLGKEGFAAANKLCQAIDENKGPRFLFADGTQSLYLADMSGDGLSDILRVRNGEVSYWPNLGYGRFGAKVVMDHAPWFDAPDQFDQRYIHLADLDGSGATDIIYLSRGDVRLYFNQSGNRWSDARSLKESLPVDDLSVVTVVDLLGNGTASLVWSSPLPAHIGKSMRYIRMMQDKPHLLTRMVNNLGAETRVSYAPSTRFYLEDKIAGKPWITKLPFVVHVVEKVESFDHISRSRFATRYGYHHGYFDGIEREFRGFGMVEQWDTELSAALTADSKFPNGDNINATSHVPPVHTRTWFHTGVYFDNDRFSQFFAGLLNSDDAGEYYREPNWLHDNVEARKHLLEDSILPAGLTPTEQREACRALKGRMLRQEIYALDGTSKSEHPYTIVEQNFALKRLQPQQPNRHAVFFTHEREVINYNYEREPTDPRTTHTLTLSVDNYGNVLRSISVAYKRADVADRQPTQNDTHLTLTLNRVFNRDDQIDWRRLGLPVEKRTYELIKPPEPILRFSWGELRDLIQALVPGDQIEPLTTKIFPSAEWDWRKRWDPRIEPGGNANTRLRLIENVRSLYRPDDLGVARNDVLTLLPLGTAEQLAVPGETFKLAFTPDLLTQVYKRPFAVRRPIGSPPAENLLPTPSTIVGGPGSDLGGYVNLDGDGRWWIPSGRLFYSPGAGDAPTDELAHARRHFFRPHRHRDPFHTNAVSTEGFIKYDDYDLLVLETRDAVNNRITAGERDGTGRLTIGGNDYRVLQPRLVMDANGNRSAGVFDALGFVVGTAVMGKPLPATIEGDSLDTFEPDLTEAVVLEHLARPLVNPEVILSKASTRLVYDLNAYQHTKNSNDPQPVVVYTLARETHDSDPVPSGGLKIRHSFSYSDGFGREIQKKAQAESGPTPRRDINGKIVVGADGRPALTTGDVDPRWLGSGWIVQNNKGKPIRQYEPFFTDTPRFEFDLRIGVSRLLFYDPLGRVVATLHPNHTWEKVVSNPWQQETWDGNDTVLIEPQNDAHVKGFFVYPNGAPRLNAGDFLPTWHALRTGSAHTSEANARWPDATIRTAERAAAEKAAIHAATPTIAHFDSLGRTFLTVAKNRFKRSDSPPAVPPTEETHRHVVNFDIEGNEREAIDAKGRLVMLYDYDLLGNRIHQASMEAGERWMLNDVTGKPIRSWDSRAHIFRTEYDSLRRPIRLFVTGADSATLTREVLTERFVYGEQHPDNEPRNLRGVLFLHCDQSGVIINERYDFKGNLRLGSRRIASEYKRIVSWSAIDAVLPGVSTDKLNAATLEATLSPMLELETYRSRTLYDALNRPVQTIAPLSDQAGAKRNIIQPVYNEGNLLDRVDVWLDHPIEPAGLLDVTADTPSPVGVKNIDYDAKGQRQRIDYKNGATTRYSYDAETFRLVQLYTHRGAAFNEDCGDSPSRFPAPELPPPNTSCGLQNIYYTYDPVGNIAQIRDDAQQTIYFKNQRVEPSCDYTYDSLYRLIEATGREHLGQVRGAPSPGSYNDQPHLGILLSASDGDAMGRYFQSFDYDPAGNLTEMVHTGTTPINPGWTRSYLYKEASLLEKGPESNRLTSTTIGSTTETYSATGDGYDVHGNMLRLPQLQTMQWDFKDQLQMTQRQAINADDNDGAQHQGERTWYTYDAGGQRVRKVTELVADQIKEERIYLGGFEIYRRRGINPVKRETFHVMDDKRRIALIETRTEGTETGVPAQVVRYQFENHLGSASLELNDQAQIISYEEYYPYGNTSFQAVQSQTQTPKRYRYTGKERDEESGLYYHGARYYASWLGRWTSCDPAGMVDGPNLLAYGRNNPIKHLDPTGTDAKLSDAIESTPLTPRETRIREQLRIFDSMNSEQRTKELERMTPAEFEVFRKAAGIARIERSSVANKAYAGAAERTKGTPLLTTVAGAIGLSPLAFAGAIVIAPSVIAGGSQALTVLNTAYISAVVRVAVYYPRLFAAIRFVAAVSGVSIPEAPAGQEAERRVASGLVEKAAPAIRQSPYRIYSARELARRAAEPGPFHNFPESFNKEIFDTGTRNVTENFFNVAKPQLSNTSIQYFKPGFVNGVKGVFEIFTRPSISGKVEVIMHRFFNPDRR